MNKVLTVSTAPVTEPVTLAEAKLHLRVDSNDEDAMVTSLIAAARDMAETYSRRSLVTRTYDFVMDEWWDNGVLWLPMPPVQSVTSVTYVDKDGVTHTLPNTSYYLDTAMGRLCMVYDASFPSTTLRPTAAITVRYVAGYGAANAVPDAYKAAIKLIVGHWYSNRETVVTGTITAQLPMAAESLLLMNRAWIPG